MFNGSEYIINIMYSNPHEVVSAIKIEFACSRPFLSPPPNKNDELRWEQTGTETNKPRLIDVRTGWCVCVTDERISSRS